MKNQYPSNDTEYRDVTLESVEKTDSGYTVSFDGWHFNFNAETNISPRAGQTARVYGKKFGVVRGLFIDGVKVFYRSETQQSVYIDEMLYGKSIRDWLERWDAGQCVLSVSMGGLSPSYEQAIQILAVELIRYMISAKADWWSHETEAKNEAAWKALRTDSGRVVNALDETYGYSGAQVAAAYNLASILYQRGPIDALKDTIVEERKILISKDFPVYSGPVELATTSKD